MRNGIAAYQQLRAATENPKDAEARIIRQRTSDLEASAASGDRGAMAQAVFLNRRMWFALIEDLAQPTNMLADGLKAQLISIGLTVDRVSSEVLDGKEGISDLIAINRGILGTGA
jgi:flagellar protein FlaF